MLGKEISELLYNKDGWQIKFNKGRIQPYSVWHNQAIDPTFRNSIRDDRWRVIWFAKELKEVAKRYNLKLT